MEKEILLQVNKILLAILKILIYKADFHNGCLIKLNFIIIKKLTKIFDLKLVIMK